MKYVTVILLYTVFAVAALFSGVIGLVMLPFKPRYTANVMHSLDMLLAAMLGFDGRSTVSKECARRDCRFCRVLCALLHRFLEENHCEKEAARR